jgi:hypothetical protein
MPNTTAENQRARQAATIVLSEYRAYVSDPLLTHLTSADDIELAHYIKFYDDGPFSTNLKLFDAGPPTGCHVSAFTDRPGKPLLINNNLGKPVMGSTKHAVVYVNRDHATAGTLVHELLHAVSSLGWYLWAASKQPNPNEAVTEWLTRRALKRTTDTDFQNVDRSANYQADFRNWKEAKTQLKAEVGDIGNTIRLAYFQGTVSTQMDQVMGMFQTAGVLNAGGGAALAVGGGGRRGRGWQ